MEEIISWEELGVDCPFEAPGLTGYEALFNIMRHVRSVHTRDRHDLESIHAAAHALLRDGAG